MTIKSHRDLIVWQKAMVLAAEVYRLTKVFPADERFRMTDQLLRAASSIPANIAEGHARGTMKTMRISWSLPVDRWPVPRHFWLSRVTRDW